MPTGRSARMTPIKISEAFDAQHRAFHFPPRLGRPSSSKKIWLEEWTVDYLRSVFRYEWDTGRLYWRSNGHEAGVVVVSGLCKYLVCRLDGERVFVHRLIWAIHKEELPGQFDIDHQDGDGLNNRIANLRLATPSMNAKNVRLSRRNKSGHPGVTQLPSGMWQAVIKIDGKKVNLGTYRSLADAVDVRKRCERLAGFHVNHGRIS